MTAQILDISGRADRVNLAWHHAATDRLMGVWERASDRLVSLITVQPYGEPLSAEIWAALAASQEAQARAEEMARRTAELEKAVVARFEEEIVAECKRVTARALTETGGLEAGILTVRAKMQESLRAEVTGDPTLFDRVVATLREQDARWAHFYRYFEQEISA